MRNAARLILGLSLGALSFVATRADAHFYLDTPAADNAQDATGNPQKASPCGGGDSPSGEITAYQSGQTITITIDETIFHPGHYRVAVADDPSQLPDEPPVTVGSTACGSVPIQDPPVFPVLADGMLVHDEPFDGPQSFTVTLPADFTCDGCTLQILEFMAEHSAPCFYYHCATITVTEEPVVAGPSSSSSGGGDTGGNGSGGSGSGNGAAGSGAGPGAGGSGGEPTAQVYDNDDGCSVSAPAGGTSGLLGVAAGLVGAALVFGRRRRRG